jgi:hypothetical protein
MLQPTLGLWAAGARLAATASIAAVSDAPVTGVGSDGRLSSNWPR